MNHSVNLQVRHGGAVSHTINIKSNPLLISQNILSRSSIFKTLDNHQEYYLPE